MAKRRVKAVCLLSGGVDSSLAALLLKEQGIQVIGLNFVLPFEEIFKLHAETAAMRIATQIGIHLKILTMDEDYVEILRNPPHGYGSQVNPCIDCHIYMFRKARGVMEEEGADFVATGEVLGQRPMSQRRDALRVIEKESGLDGYLLRPLSALLLEPTVPEKAGLVDRERLLGFRGRSRKEILNVARSKGLTHFTSPAGGCLFTDPGFAKRVRDLIEHNMLSLRELRRLALGRHMRLDGAKLIVGRNGSENALLVKLSYPGDIVLRSLSIPGPTAILTGKGAEANVEMAAAIVARYSDAQPDQMVKVEIRKDEARYEITRPPLEESRVAELLI